MKGMGQSQGAVSLSLLFECPRSRKASQVAAVRGWFEVRVLMGSVFL